MLIGSIDVQQLVYSLKKNLSRMASIGKFHLSRTLHLILILSPDKSGCLNAERRGGGPQAHPKEQRTGGTPLAEIAREDSGGIY